MLTIVDYGVGNLASMQNMLKKIGVPCLVSSQKKDIESAEKLILPGVGAFDTCAQKLEQSGLIEILNQRVLQDKTPVLGVCVGHQLLMQESEEGELPGLGWIKGKIVKFKQELLPVNTKVPHMGWTEVDIQKSSKLFEMMPAEPRFYFVHSYHAQLASEDDILIYAEYGYRFVAGVERHNVYGVQFHPEKSHKFGMQLLYNFSKISNR